MSKSKKDYHRTLPKKRMASGALILNRSGEILLLKPSYKPVWEIPGGVVELQESPLQACRREIKEEIGIDIEIGQLLCVDYQSENDQRTEAVNFIFFGGVLSAEAIEQLQVDQKEILTFAFFTPDKVAEKTAATLGGRIAQSMEALNLGKTVYLEDQQLPH